MVGGGPAGLECAMTLGKRGYKVMLAETRARAGRAGQPGEPPAGPRRAGRGCATIAWGRSSQLANVEVFLESELDKEQICGHRIAAM